MFVRSNGFFKNISLTIILEYQPKSVTFFPRNLSPHDKLKKENLFRILRGTFLDPERGNYFFSNGQTSSNHFIGNYTIQCMQVVITGTVYTTVLLQK